MRPPRLSARAEGPGVRGLQGPASVQAPEAAQLQPSGRKGRELAAVFAAATLGATGSAAEPLGEAHSVWPWAPK